MEFPIGLNEYKPLQFDLAQDELSLQQKEQLVQNIQLVRDSIIFFTAFLLQFGEYYKVTKQYNISLFLL